MGSGREVCAGAICSVQPAAPAPCPCMTLMPSQREEDGPSFFLIVGAETSPFKQLERKKSKGYRSETEVTSWQSSADQGRGRSRTVRNRDKGPGLQVCAEEKERTGVEPQREDERWRGPADKPEQRPENMLVGAGLERSFHRPEASAAWRHEMCSCGPCLVSFLAHIYLFIRNTGSTLGLIVLM